MIAKTLELELGEFIHTLGDAHYNTNHIEQAKLLWDTKEKATLEIVNKRDDIFSYVFEDFHPKTEAHDHIKLLFQSEVMSIKIIAAHSSNRIIGNKGTIPWFIKGELRRFRDITMNHNVVMGRKTYESIGKVLDGEKISWF